MYSTYDPRLRDSNIVGFIPPNYDITLNEGDVLYVPKHYWHFVETSSAISLSINLWLPFPMPAQASFSQFERNTVVKSDEEVHTIAGKEEDKASIMTSNAHHNESVIVADVHTLKSLSKIDIEKNSMEEIFPFVANCEPSVTNCSSKKVEFEQSSSGNNRDLGPCVDPQSRVIEALSRVLYGALKGTASRVFDTDSPRSGWINPSEQGGTLDFSAWNLPLSSNSREECEMSEKRNNGDDDDDDDDKIRDNLGPRSSDDDSDSSCSDEDVGEVRMRKFKKWQLMDKNAKLHLEYLYMSLEEKRLEDRKQEKRSVDDKKEKEIDFEGLLKRFFNALLDPENIERCLIASTDK